MKSTAIVCAIAAASLSFSALSFAQGNDRRGARDELPRAEQQGPRHFDQREQMRNERHDGRRDDRRFDNRNDHRFDYRDARRSEHHYYYNARSPDFRRGGHIPREFRDRQYYVTDYRAHRLSPPPRGQQWVQVGPDYVLIAIATGLIAHMVLSQ
ncbi:RcnB family protein [Rhodoferax ferrireducens]|uniref:RcnB family protein n=1 Tax=Rhodoferax ferrireducens TaxID=192843 RepID=UPI000E0D364F|nr:RcnB family protein [Rhodoferax ferrireducens]